MEGNDKKEGIRIAATLQGGLKKRFTTYAKSNNMKTSEVIKEAVRQLTKGL